VIILPPPHHDSCYGILDTLKLLEVRFLRSQIRTVVRWWLTGNLPTSIVSAVTGFRMNMWTASGRPMNFYVPAVTFKTHLKSHLFNTFPSVWLYRWLFFRQSPWSCLCCIRLSKFVIITLHYITRVVHLWPSDMTVISDCCVYCIHCIFGKIGLHCYFHSGYNYRESETSQNVCHLSIILSPKRPMPIAQTLFSQMICHPGVFCPNVSTPIVQWHSCQTTWKWISCTK